MQKINKVIVVFKTHFDNGFTGLAREVMKEYTGPILKAAVETCEKTAHREKEHRYVWTMPSWLLTQCLKEELVGSDMAVRVDRLVKNGQMIWHALPFTTNTEACGVEDYIRCLEFSTELSKKYGYWPLSAKMTDVPGHTWMLPSIMDKAGIKFLHLGCNPGFMPPEVPRLFYWEGADGSQTMTYYSKGDYGTSLVPPQDWNFPVWLALIHTNDNLGPHGPGIIDEILAEAKNELGDAEIVFGTLDDFYREVAELNPDLPVVRGDMGDAWIHGVGSFPNEVAQVRELRNRLTEIEKIFNLSNSFIKNGECHKYINTTIKEIYEQLNLFGEHTWGLDVKTEMKNNRHYKKQEFLANKDTQLYKRMEESWDEKSERVRKALDKMNVLSNYINENRIHHQDTINDQIKIFNGLGWKRDALVTLEGYDSFSKDYVLQDSISKKEYTIVNANKKAFSYIEDLPAFGYKNFELVPKNPNMTNDDILQCDCSKGIIENKWFKIQVDTKKGIISSLLEKHKNKEWVQSHSTCGFGQYRYDVYGDEDITEYIRSCTYRFYDWFINDFGRMGYPSQEHLAFTPENFTLSSETNELFVKLSLKANVKDDSFIKYGNTEKLIFTITLYRHLPYIDLEFSLDNKQETAFVEAGHIAFPINLEKPSIRINKPGSLVNPDTDIIKGANNVLFCCENWVDLSDEKNGIAIIPYATPLFSIGKDGMLQYCKTYVESAPVLNFNLFNNTWGTNFPQWMGGNYNFKYRIICHEGNANEGQIWKKAYEAMNPCVLVDANLVPDESLSLEVMQITEGMVISAIKATANDGESVILRVRELKGEKYKVGVRFGNVVKEIVRCDLQERVLNVVSSNEDELSFETEPYEIHTFLVNIK